MHSTPALPTPNDRLRLAYRLFLFMRLLYTFTSHQQTSYTTTPTKNLQFSATCINLKLLPGPFICTFLLALKGYSNRRWWRAPCSQHWINMVMAEETLHGGEFERTFRMTRNSFNQLHAPLGILPF